LQNILIIPVFTVSEIFANINRKVAWYRHQRFRRNDNGMADLMESKWLRKYYRVLLVPITFIGFYFLVYLVNPYSNYWTFARRKPYDLTIEFSMILLLCYIIVEICLYTSRKLDPLIPWEKSPFQRAVVQLSTQIAFIWIFEHIMGRTVLRIFFGEMIAARTGTLMEQLDRWRYLIVSVAVTFLLNSIVTGHYFLARWRDSMMEAAELKLHAARLKQMAMQAELQSLKLQLDPHFMFNNFSTLSELISENQQLAQSFIEHLSKVYRYMILNIHYDTISLQKELKFIQSYIYLITIRHGDNVRITIDVPDAVLEKQIPPITIQLLLENAIKHNIASPRQPLHVAVRLQGDDLLVSNNLQRIDNTALQSSQIGLKNIRERYRLVFGREPEVVETDETFMVVLPLMD